MPVPAFIEVRRRLPSLLVLLRPCRALGQNNKDAAETSRVSTLTESSLHLEIASPPSRLALDGGHR